MHTGKKVAITSLLIVSFLSLVAIASLIAIFRPGQPQETYVADIYQNGELIRSIPLDPAAPGQTFTIEGENHCFNRIEIRGDSIGIAEASCPDKLCVHQGFIRSSRLPITCLPNRLVIQLRKADSQAPGGLPSSLEPDAISY